MLAVVAVVDDGDDAHRAPRGVSVAMFGQFLEAFGMVLVPCRPKITVFTKCFALGTVFTVLFGQHLAETLAITLSSCCKKYFFHAKVTKPL